MKRARTRTKPRCGLSDEEYMRMFLSQDGVCAICENPPKTYNLAVDHDHRTGIVRGLLCSYCNRMIGTAWRGNLESWRRALRYLEKHAADVAPIELGPHMD